MKTIYANNVNGALRRGLRYLAREGREEPSRNGPVLVAPGPVMTVYSRPWQRVLFSPLRDANPFFHLFEALWMLAGRNDVAFPAYYAAQLQLYSDDNETLNGAYGFRWRHHFGYDQLDEIVGELRRDPASRRCVLAMWDARDTYDVDTPDPDFKRAFSAYEGDLKRALAGGKDVPCNTHVYFRVNEGKLDMTVCNRSNDAVWGAYGANAVHFSVLQEYVAAKIGVLMGRYYQFANNFHVYLEREDVCRLLSGDAQLRVDPYKTAEVGTVPLTVAGELNSFLNDDLEDFLSQTPAVDRPEGAYRTRFFKDVVRPMVRAHTLYKNDRVEEAANYLSAFIHLDWLRAGAEWMERRAVARAAKART